MQRDLPSPHSKGRLHPDSNFLQLLPRTPSSEERSKGLTRKKSSRKLLFPPKEGGRKIGSKEEEAQIKSRTRQVQGKSRIATPQRVQRYQQFFKGGESSTQPRTNLKQDEQVQSSAAYLKQIQSLRKALLRQQLSRKQIQEQLAQSQRICQLQNSDLNQLQLKVRSASAPKTEQDQVVDRSLAVQNKLLKEQLVELHRKARQRAGQAAPLDCQRHGREISDLRERVELLEGQVVRQEEELRSARQALSRRRQQQETLLRLAGSGKECYRISDMKLKLEQIGEVAFMMSNDWS